MKSIIIYATKYGTTTEVANRIKALLVGDTTLCNVMKESVPSLDGFDTVILGGPVYIGRVQKEIAKYAVSHSEELLSKKLGLFLCGGETKEDVVTKEMQDAFTDSLCQHAAAKDVLGFALYFEKMKFMERFLMKKMKGTSTNVEEFHEDKIKQFAETMKN